MEKPEALRCPVAVVSFEDMKKTIYGRGEDIELEFHLNDCHLAVNHLSDIRIYKHGWSDPASSILHLPSSLWLQNGCSDTFTVHFSVDLLDLNGIYQACYVSDGKVFGRSALFRSPSSMSTESDDGFELVVPRPWEVREKEVIGQDLELHKSRCKRLFAYTEALHSTIRATNNHLIEEKVYNKELQKTVRLLVEEKEKATQEAALLRNKLAETQAALTEKDGEVKSLNEAAREKDNKLAALKSEMALRVGILEEERLSLQRQMKENNERHRRLKEEYQLSQLHLENAKERLEAHESTKQLLHAELVAVKECKTQVNNNVINSPAVLELQEKVRELVDRLNAAAGEYTKLYKENKRQEKLLLHFCHLEKEKMNGTIAALTSGKPCQRPSIDPCTHSLQPTPNNVLTVLPRGDISAECGVLPDKSHCPPEAHVTAHGCKACPPTMSHIAQPNTKADSCYIGGARAKDSSDLHGLPPSSRERGKGATPTFPCGKWSSLRRVGHVCVALSASGKKLHCSLKERKSSLPLLSSALSRASCPVKKLEYTAPHAGAMCGQSTPSTEGANSTQTKNSNFVAIQMLDLTNEDSCHPNLREKMACAFCLKQFSDMEQHL